MQALFSLVGSTLHFSCASTDCLYFAPRSCAKLQREPSRSNPPDGVEAGQPPGGAAFGSARWRSAPGTAWRERPRLYSQLQGKMVPVMLILRTSKAVGLIRCFLKIVKRGRGNYSHPNTTKH